jgi:hypothetical protein
MISVKKHQHNAVAGTKVMIVFFHGSTTLDQRVLHLVIECAMIGSIRLIYLGVSL